MSPEAFRQWQAIFRDVTITVVAAFMLVYETVFVASANPYIVGAGLTLLGAPAAIRLDKLRRDRNGDTSDRHDDPYDGPGGYFRG